MACTPLRSRWEPFLGTPAAAQDLIEEYRAYISERDLHNSAGERLTRPWEIIRQDRANYHKFGVPDLDDYYDGFFAPGDT